MHVEHIGHKHEKRGMLFWTVKVALSHIIILKADQPVTHLRIVLLLGVQLPQSQPQTIRHPQFRVLYQAPG